MAETRRVLAFDFGASSGRAMIGEYDGEKITLKEVHRFSNDPVIVGDTMHWDKGVEKWRRPDAYWHLISGLPVEEP